VINTADYWAGIIPQLTAEIRGKVDEISRPEVAPSQVKIRHTFIVPRRICTQTEYLYCRTCYFYVCYELFVELDMKICSFFEPVKIYIPVVEQLQIDFLCF